MLMLIYFPPPTDGIIHEEPSTKLFASEREIGCGTLYITGSKLYWRNDTSGEGLSMLYSQVAVHTVSRDVERFGSECMIIMVDTYLDDIDKNGEEENNEGERRMTELRFVPDDKNQLDIMYQAITHCQTHQPDPYDSFSEDRDCVVSPALSNPAQVLASSVKKIQVGKLNTELQKQLRVETRQEQLNPKSMYNPLVKTISPSNLWDNIIEDANFRSIKDYLLQQIGKVDNEISKTESNVLKLKKKEQGLVGVAGQLVEKKDEEEDHSGKHPKHLSLAQKIYAENRRRAQEAQLEKLGPKVEFPLYNQPSDTAVYHENKRRHCLFRKRLMEHLYSSIKERKMQEEYLIQTYSRMVQEWRQNVEKVECSTKRIAKDAKNRELFEKVFPELRKQQKNCELGTRTRSGTNVKEDRLQEQEMEIKKMRLNAVIPPLLLDARQRKYCYINNNGKIEDFVAEYKERQMLNVWTKVEKDIFKEKFLQHPKNFCVIASYLNHKNVSDCVQYYYHSKKEENYKRLLRLSRQRTRSAR